MNNLMTNLQASIFLNVAVGTLANSRNTGKLLGIDAPSYIKNGGTVRYSKSDLEKWLYILKSTKIHSRNDSSNLPDVSLNIVNLKWNFTDLPDVDEIPDGQILAVAKLQKLKDGELMYELHSAFVTSYDKHEGKWTNFNTVHPNIDVLDNIEIVKWAKLTTDFISSGIDSEYLDKNGELIRENPVDTKASLTELLNAMSNSIKKMGDNVPNHILEKHEELKLELEGLK